MKKIILGFLLLMNCSLFVFAGDVFVRSNTTTAKTGVKIHYNTPITQIDLQNVAIVTADSLVFDFDDVLGYSIDFKISAISTGSVATTASISFRSKAGTEFETTTITSGQHYHNTKSAYIRVTIPILNTIPATLTGNVKMFEHVSDIEGEVVSNFTVNTLLTAKKISALDSTGLTLTDDSGTATNGLFIKDAGNVGVGTIIPQYKLSVSGNTGVTGNLKVTGTLNVTGNSILTGTLRNVGNTRLDGTVGIGTSTPQRKLSLVGDKQVTGNEYTTGYVSVGTPYTSGTSGTIYASSSLQSTGGFAVRTAFLDANGVVSITPSVGGASKPGIALGAGQSTAVDVKLYRDSADNLKTDDTLTVALGVNLGTSTLAGTGSLKASGTITSSGNIRTVGGICVGSTVANATAGQGKFTGDVITSGNFISSQTGYANIYVSGNVTATDILNTWTIITANMTTKKLKGMTHTAGLVTVTYAGDYKVEWWVHISDKTALDDLRFGVAINGVYTSESAGSVMDSDDTAATSTYAAGAAMVTVTAGQTIGLMIRNITSASRDCTFEFVNLLVTKLAQ